MTSVLAVGTPTKLKDGDPNPFVLVGKPEDWDRFICPAVGKTREQMNKEYNEMYAQWDGYKHPVHSAMAIIEKVSTGNSPKKNRKKVNKNARPTNLQAKSVSRRK